MSLFEESGLTIPEIALKCGVTPAVVSRSIYEVRNKGISFAGVRELTARQLEILALVGMGFSDKEIGVELYLSPKTIEVQVKLARERLNARNRVECVIIAIAHELLILGTDGELRVPHALRQVV